MLNIFKNIFFIFFKGFFSSNYFILNLFFYALLGAGFYYNIIYGIQVSLYLFSIATLLFILIVYFDWRINKLTEQYYYFFYALNFAPFAILILDNKNNVISYNDICQVLCENKEIKTFEDFKLFFQEYTTIINALEVGIKTVEFDSSYYKDINLGEKIWRIGITSKLSKIGSIKILFIIDITSEISNDTLETSLANMLNNVDEGIIVTNRTGNIVFYNISASNIFKTSLTGKNIKQIQGLQNLQPNIVNKTQHQNQSMNIFVNYHNKDYIMHKIQVLSYSLDDIFQEAPMGIIVINEDLEIQSYNLFWKKLFKRKFTIEECVAKQQRDVFSEFIKHIFRAHKLSSMSVNLLEENGVLVTVFAQFHNGNINLFFIEDVQSKEIKAQFLHEQRLYSLGEIVGSVSHDFNNIITTVLNNCDAILERNSFSPANKDYVDLMRIKHSASRAASLVKQILNISRKQELNDKTMNVSDNVFEFISTIGRSLGNNFDLKIIKRKENVNIFINEVTFEQILINLLLNARDAMPYGGVIQVIVDTFKIEKNIFENGYYVVKGDYLELSITDSGIGISQENIKRIFEPFFTTKKDKGTGFGLSTVNNLVKQKGGFIKVSSKLGVGTTFMIYLPIFNDENPKATITYNKFHDNLKILFIEDEVNILIPAVKNLQNRGLNVIGTSKPKEALEKGKNMPKLDILITDISMPDINGIEIFKELEKQFKDLKVIFTSGYSSEKTNDLDNNRVFFLAKPYSMKDLYSYIERCID